MTDIKKQSHPTRGAWIETFPRQNTNQPKNRRTPPGVRGLKLQYPQTRPWCPGRTPPGVRGLKPYLPPVSVRSRRSHPTRGAWIETIKGYREDNCQLSHPTRGAWIETSKIAVCKLRTVKSHPTRGAWIETPCFSPATRPKTVAPHPGCVD